MADKDMLERLESAIERRRTADPAISYVASLHTKGIDQILRKVGEEAVEVVLASKSGDREQVIRETADLWFHCLVMLSYHHVKVAEVLRELERREGRSGIDEKSSRNKEKAP